MPTIESLRQYRFGDFAYFDTFGSLLGVIVLSPLLTKLFLKVNLYIPLRSWIFLTFPIAIIAHVLIDQKTPLSNLFWGNDDYISKIFIVSCLVIAVKGMKINSKSDYKAI